MYRTSNIQPTYCFRPSSLALLTIGQTQTEYRLAKPEAHSRYKDKEPTLSPNRYILVSGQNENVPEEERRLPSHIELSDGSILVLLTTGKPRVINPKKHKDKHAQMYADMFLYLPWQDEKQFLGEASRSKEVCQAMWDEWGDAAKDLKEQLYDMIKRSWLSCPDEN